MIADHSAVVFVIVKFAVTGNPYKSLLSSEEMTETAPLDDRVPLKLTRVGPEGRGRLPALTLSRIAPVMRSSTTVELPSPKPRRLGDAVKVANVVSVEALGGTVRLTVLAKFEIALKVFATSTLPAVKTRPLLLLSVEPIPPPFVPLMEMLPAPSCGILAPVKLIAPVLGTVALSETGEALNPGTATLEVKPVRFIVDPDLLILNVELPSENPLSAPKVGAGATADMPLMESAPLCGSKSGTTGSVRLLMPRSEQAKRGAGRLRPVLVSVGIPLAFVMENRPRLSVGSVAIGRLIADV
jgi:hypothetical protein